MRTRQATKAEKELVSFVITAANKFLSRPNRTVEEEDNFWAALCDDHYTFPGAGPPDPDTSRQRTTMFVCDYTLVWYETDKNRIQRRVMQALLDLLEY